MGIPVKLKEIAEYLSDNPVVLSSRFKDGRVNAVPNEREVLRAIPRKFGISKPAARAWYDFSMEADGGFCPVNIKVADFTTGAADNLNCKLGVYYALTGQMPPFPNEVGWKVFFDSLKADLGSRKNGDYFFLVLNKSAEGDVVVNSLRGLSSLHANGNNLPFQCVWGENRDFQERSFDEAVAFIMKPFGEGVVRRSQIYFDFKEAFPEYV